MVNVNDIVYRIFDDINVDATHFMEPIKRGMTQAPLFTPEHTANWLMDQAREQARMTIRSQSDAILSGEFGAANVEELINVAEFVHGYMQKCSEVANLIARYDEWKNEVEVY